MPWTLRLPFDTVDARVFVRQSISELRRDPAVTDVQLQPNLPRSAWFDTVLVQVEFLEGHDQPADLALAERLRVYLPRGPERSQAMVEGFRRNYGLDRPNENGDLFTPELRQQLIDQYLGNPEGRTRLAASFANPIRRNRDYQAIGRRTFLVEQLPDGALPVYTDPPWRPESRFNPPPEPPPFVTPDWIQPGAFARFVGPSRAGHSQHGRIVEIESIVGSFIRVWTWSRVGTWARDTEASANDVILASSFAILWEPVERPTEPQTAWDRLLGDEAPEDAPCGPQEPAREPGGARTAWSRLGWDEPWQGPLRTQPLPEGALPVYD